MNFQKMSNEELMKELDAIYEEWDRSNTVLSLSDFEEIVRELTLRENQ